MLRAAGGLILGARLGQGGMSQVRAGTAAGGRRVAVKFPRADGAGGSRAAGHALIRREFAFLDAISHRNVVAVEGLTHVPDGSPTGEPAPGIVMEYLGGGDLVSLAGASPRQWAPVAAQVACAVAELHGAGIVHRDLKPRNVLLGSADVPRLIDFALAAPTGAAAPAGGGTPAYRRGRLSGEGAVADDVYAMAVLVHELWLGELPFGVQPTSRARQRWRGFPRFGPVPGVRGLRRLADLLSELLAQRAEALAAGVRPLRHALESVATEV